MEEKIYKILKKHKLPLKKREELIKDLLPLFSVVCSALSDDHAITILENCPFEESGYCNAELKCRFKLESPIKNDNGCELCL